MSTLIFDDIKKMYLKYDFINGAETPSITPLMSERLAHLKEEYDETVLATKNKDLEEVVDGLIDIMVIAAGTLHLCGVDPQAHWDEVLRANMTKERGINPKRNHKIDIIKPESWIGPNHTAILEKTISEKTISEKTV